VKTAAAEGMETITVGIADCKVSGKGGGMLVTYALGSCIAVAIHDPLARIAGLLHVMLPESSLDPVKAAARPHMFADTGIPALFKAAYAEGADKRRLQVRLVGGAQVMDDGGLFNIGKRNHLACRKILWSAGVLVSNEAVGGTISRTVRLEVESGRLWWSHGSDVQELLVRRGDSKCCYKS
jgi:chemotaxis protein CheD